MAFPATLDVITTPGAYLDTVAHLHSTIHNDVKTLLEAVQAKVGVDTSAVTSTLDYKVRKAMGPLQDVQALTTSVAAAVRVTGDTQDRLQILGDGKHSWGPGNATQDAVLARTGVAILSLTGALQSSTDQTARQGAATQVGMGALGPAAEAAIAFGSDADAKIYRDASNSLRTPGVLTVDGAGTITGVLTMSNNLKHTGSNIGFFNTTPTTKKTVTGSRGANAALASLCTQLAAYGLITDSTT